MKNFLIHQFTYRTTKHTHVASKVTKNTIAIMIEPVQGEGGVHPATQEGVFNGT